VLGVINCSKPVVSAIEGTAVGGPLSAALVADISIAGRSAKIIDPHTQLGLVAGDGAAMIWPLLCGMAKTKLYLLTGAALTGQEAERIGLVSMVADDARVVEVALAIAERIASTPRAGANWTKLALNGWLRLAQPSFDASVALEFMTLRGP